MNVDGRTIFWFGVWRYAEAGSTKIAFIWKYGHNEMTMMKSKIVPAAQFKAECLALLDRVAETGESLVITKRGRPVARIVPVESAKPNSLLGSVREVGDIVAPIGVVWEANR